jgi:Holliday junction DNA helicase RuvA
VASKTADLLTSALTNLGYRPTDADRALQALGERVESLSMSELLREALVALSK